MNTVRLFLLCYGDAEGEKILSKWSGMCVGMDVCGVCVISNGRVIHALIAGRAADISCTLWWTPAHDIRLLKLLLKHGWGNWRAMCSDEDPNLGVAAVPKGFVPPPREGSDGITTLAPSP